MKKFLALILSLLLLVTALPLTASAETGDIFEYEGFSYKIEGDSRAVIIGCEPTENGELIIPSEIDGLTTIDIDYRAFQNTTWIKSLFISSSVSHIWEWAFDGCTELEQITFSEGISYIGSMAFAHCPKLSEVILPTTLFLIENDSFFECTSLPALTFAGENENFVELDGILYNETMNKIMCIPGGYSGEFLVRSTVNVIPNTEGCPGVTAFSVEEGNEYFSAVDGMLYDKEQTNIISCPRAKFSEPTEYTIPEGVIGFSSGAFRRCQNITKITVPAWVEWTGMYAFADCPDLTEIVFEEGFNSFNSFCDGVLSGCTNVKKVVIPASVTSFGQFTSTDNWNFTVYGIPKSYAERFTSLYNVPFVPMIKGIVVSSLPDKTVYPVDGILNTDGLVVNAVLEDDTEIDITDLCDIGACDLTYAGKKKVTVTYCGFSTYFNITVDRSELLYPESDFESPSGFDKTWTSVYPTDAEMLQVTFSEGTRLNTGDDFIYIYDGSDNLIGTYSGDELRSKTILVPGNVFKVRLTIGYKECYTSSYFKVTDIRPVEFNPSDDVFEYSVADGKAAITGLNKTVGGTINIPESLGGYPVTSISDSAFAYSYAITDVTIPSSVETIGASAFAGCNLLENVTFSEGLLSVGKYAFENCSALKKAVLPGGVTDVGDGAFKKCVSLTYAELPDGITAVADSAFMGCSALKEVVLPESITDICDYAFSGCSSLDNVKLPKGIKVINNSTFNGCASLKHIEIPEGVTVIDYYAFKGCKKLEEIVIPQGVWTIYPSAFENCSALSKVVLPDGLYSIHDRVFAGCTALTEIKLPDTVTYMSSFVFEGCTGLVDVNIPDGLTNITKSLFKGCSALESIVLPDGIRYISESAFEGCTALKDVNIPESVRYIDSNAFKGCSALASIAVPDGIINIDDYAFANCTALANIKLPAGNTEFGDHVFAGCTALKNITLPKELTEIANGTFSGCKNLKNVVIPQTVTTIGAASFIGCAALQSVELPDGLKVIGSSAFENCTALKKLVIPASVNEIKSSAFLNCNCLTLYVESSSYAESYAIENAIPFVTYYSDKTVVMEKNTEVACVDGVMVPTTEYASGVFARVRKTDSGSYALPLRYIGETFGMTVDYLGAGKTKVTNAAGEYVIVNRDGAEIIKYTADGTEIAKFTSPFAAFADESITYVPMRAVGEALGLGVAYKSTAHGSYVVISTDVTIDANPDKVTGEVEKAYEKGFVI